MVSRVAVPTAPPRPAGACDRPHRSWWRVGAGSRPSSPHSTAADHPNPSPGQAAHSSALYPVMSLGVGGVQDPSGAPPTSYPLSGFPRPLSTEYPAIKGNPGYTWNFNGLMGLHAVPSRYIPSACTRGQQGCLELHGLRAPPRQPLHKPLCGCRPCSVLGGPASLWPALQESPTQSLPSSP